MGGEKPLVFSRFYYLMGSPPRGWGKALEGVALSAAHGITPAWAGKRATPTKTGCPGGDHPRVGGEKCGLGFRFELFQGSPPRGRGKDCTDVYGKFSDRITPAWAGKSPLCFPVFTTLWDHPRVGGEKTGTPWRWLMVTGSPPRGRGKEAGCVQPKSPVRITPAWAGKS